MILFAWNIPCHCCHCGHTSFLNGYIEQVLLEYNSHFAVTWNGRAGLNDETSEVEGKKRRKVISYVIHCVSQHYEWGSSITVDFTVESYLVFQPFERIYNLTLRKRTFQHLRTDKEWEKGRARGSHDFRSQASRERKKQRQIKVTFSTVCDSKKNSCFFFQAFCFLDFIWW